MNHKTVFGTRNPAFWVGAVTGSCFFSVVLLSVHVAVSLCVGLVALLQNLDLALGLCGFANVPPNALAISQILFLLSFDES
jgi:hypothetical protein